MIVKARNKMTKQDTQTQKLINNLQRKIENIEQRQQEILKHTYHQPQLPMLRSDMQTPVWLK